MCRLLEGPHSKIHSLAVNSVMEPAKDFHDLSEVRVEPSYQQVVKEPELVTIIEGKPLTSEQLEQDSDNSCDDASEYMPLLRSTETNRSMDFLSLTTSQASLFIPSVQFSLYSSRGHDFSQHSSRISLKGSFMENASRSTQSVQSTRGTANSYSASILAKITEDGQASGVLALWNVINMIQGSGGMMGLPYAIALGGFPALVLIILVGMMTNASGILLIDCLYQISSKTKLRKRVRSSYADIAAECWGPTGGRLVDLMTVSTCYCTCILYVMMLGSSFMGMFRDIIQIGITEWCLISTLIFLPLVFIRKLAFLAWLSMLAVVALFICLFIIVGYSLTEWRSWSIDNIPDFDINTFPIAVGIIVFSYCGHAVFPGIEGSMAQPKQFNKISYTSFSIVTFSKLMLALFACLLYGAATQPIITLNINHDTQNAILSTAATVLVMINVYFSYPLNMFVATETLDIILLPKLPSCDKGGSRHAIWTILSRTVLVFITFGIAIAVPNFGLLMGVFGSVLGACISFIFPCMFHLQLKWKGLKWYAITVEVSIIVFGLIAGILGLIYSSIALKNS